jgi:hypothetical protein
VEALFDSFVTTPNLTGDKVSLPLRGDIILENLPAKSCTLTSVVDMAKINWGYFPSFSPCGFDSSVAYVLTSQGPATQGDSFEYEATIQ